MKTKHILLILALVIGLIAIAIPNLYRIKETICSIFISNPEFYQNYKALKLGMPKSEILTLFGETPAYSCRFAKSEILYYPAPGQFTMTFPDNTPERGTLFQNIEDLPDVYGHIQLAFDTNDLLCAFTFIGESYTVESRDGSVKGSHFKYLPPDSL